MIIDNNNNLIKEISPTVELLFGVFASYKKEMNEDLDFIELIDIPYVKELINKIDIKNQPYFINFVKNLRDEGDIGNFAINLDDNFNIKENTDIEKIDNRLKNTNYQELSDELKKLDKKANIKELINKYKDYFINMHKNYEFIDDLDMGDLEKFYKTGKKYNYHFIESPLFNGGFGPKRNNDFYCLIGYYAFGEMSNNRLGTTINLYHEFSHSYTNPLVDKYFDKFDVDKIYKNCLENNLVKGYQFKKTVLYEYLVRANSAVITNKYIDDVDLEWDEELGFYYIKDLFNYTKENRFKYPNYEEFMVNSLIPFMNSLVNKKKKIL